MSLDTGGGLVARVHKGEGVAAEGAAGALAAQCRGRLPSNQSRGLMCVPATAKTMQPLARGIRAAWRCAPEFEKTPAGIQKLDTTVDGI